MKKHIFNGSEIDERILASMETGLMS